MSDERRYREAELHALFEHGRIAYDVAKAVPTGPTARTRTRS